MGGVVPSTHPLPDSPRLYIHGIQWEVTKNLHGVLYQGAIRLEPQLKQALGMTSIFVFNSALK